MSERAIQIEGDLTTDGSIVYVGGMDLAEILRASLPNRPRPDCPYQAQFPGASTVRIELVEAA